MNYKFYSDANLYSDLQSVTSPNQTSAQFNQQDFAQFQSFIPDMMKFSDTYDKNTYPMMYSNYKQPSSDLYPSTLYNYMEDIQNSISCSNLKQPQNIWCDKTSDVNFSNKTEYFKDSMGSSGTHRTRQTYTKEQINLLENEFRKGRYLTKRRRKELALQTELTERQLKIWFQNRRMKWKKENNIESLTGPDGDYYAMSL